MVDAAVQRTNMVESQVRPSDVTDRRILRAMLRIPRERFVPSSQQTFAYMDDMVPLSGSSPTARGRAMLAPRTFAKLIQAADIEASDVVLDLGCGTGYSSAVIASIAETVVALEVDAGLADEAQKVLSSLDIDNVVVVTGDLSYGYPGEGPYDSIIVGGVVDELPEQLLDQLKDGGRLVAILNEGAVSRAVVWHRIGQAFDRREVFEASGAPLPGFEKAKTFVF